jgi:uncharacterized membrane protein YqaE (UPF0057 family)
MGFISNTFLIGMVLCIILYLGGQIHVSKFRASDVYYIMIMLIFTLLGYFIVSFVKHPIVLGITLLLTCVTMLIANFIIYNDT